MAKHRSHGWPRVRRLCWLRDVKAHADCWICHEPIDYSLKPSSCDMAWEPDHVRPFRDHPELELDMANIAPAHRRCNRERGAGTKANELGMASRVW